jgi:Rac GTPase-activating protein 1
MPNRDTIAFLILHLLRVAESEECKMPASNLAKVFGPTMVGYSSLEPEPMQMISETRKQQLVRI